MSRRRKNLIVDKLVDLFISKGRILTQEEYSRLENQPVAASTVVNNFRRYEYAILEVEKHPKWQRRSFSKPKPAPVVTPKKVVTPTVAKTVEKPMAKSTYFSTKTEEDSE